MSLPTGIIKAEKIILSDKVGEWCGIPYPGHPKGCPNYAKPKTQHRCPPGASHIKTILDFNQPVYIAYSTFDLERHVNKMMFKYPTWSERGWRNVLYWQNTSRSQMRGRADMAKYITGANVVVECPEGAGVNVYATCAVSGLRLEKIKDLKICHHVALVGFRPEEIGADR